LQEGLGLGLVSDQKPNVSVSSRSRKLRSRLHPWAIPPPHVLVNFGPLAAEIDPVVWGTASKFQRVSHLRSVTARQSSIGHQPNFAALDRGRHHLYLAGQPSRWALAHISSYYYYRRMWFKSCFVFVRSCVKTTAVIKDGLHFLLLAYSGCPGKEAVKQMSGFDVEFKLISVLKLNQCELSTD